MKQPDMPLSHELSLDEVTGEGVEVDIEATVDEAAALAAFLKIPAVTRMRARFSVAPWRRHGLRVAGTVDANVVQTCVVTLEPVEGTIHEEVEELFSPDSDESSASDTGSSDSEERDIEPLVDGRVDLGVLATEYLALGLDPYPRKPGVTFEQASDAGASGSGGAFAALAALRERGGKR